MSNNPPRWPDDYDLGDDNICRLRERNAEGPSDATASSRSSDTPETDDNTFTFASAQVNLAPPDYKLVRAGLARKLERERDDARGLLREVESFLILMANYHHTLTKDDKDNLAKLADKIANL